jgi:lipoprotein NlpI
MEEPAKQQGRAGRSALGGTAMLVATAMALSGCVSVTAPDKPIVIELNINIKQEVIYRLADDVRENIEANPEIF